MTGNSCGIRWWCYLLAALSWGQLHSRIASAESPRYNVLFIAADDLRCDLGCMGHPLVKTPHLNALAARGRLFTHAYCQQALCNPSRASLLSGRRPDSLRIWDLPTHFREVNPQLVTLPEYFRQQGYFTQDLGKIFHNWRQKIEGDPQSWSVPAQLHYASHGSDLPVLMDGEEIPRDFAATPRTECRDVPDEAYFDGRIAALAVEALHECSRKPEPFFLAVGFWKPHLPFNPPKRYWDLYDRKDFAPASPGVPPVDCPPIALHDGRELLRSKMKMDFADVTELQHGYLAGISFLDAQIGKLLAKLDELDLTRRTIVVFWSDHGFHLGEHGLWCKTSNFELDARVPLIIACPEMAAAGQSTDSLVELLDLYPTLVDLCDLPPRTDLEGVSLRPILDDPAVAVKAIACTQHPRPAYYQKQPQVMGVSIRNSRFRYTEWRRFESGALESAELYDHDVDPAETQNVVAAPEHAAALLDLREQIQERFPREGLQVPQLSAD